MSYTPIVTCRACGSGQLAPVLDLGEQPLANAFRVVGDDRAEAHYPLVVVRCRSCSLVQLSGTIDPSELFDEYHYFSSYSTTMLAAMAELAHATVRRHSLTREDLVVEVASNDGYLVKNYVEVGVPVLGIDPARNVADVAAASGVPTEVAYFGAAVAASVLETHGPATVIHANNVLAHVPDVNDFVAGIAMLLSERGVAIIETPHLVRMIERCEFDTVYHEHVFYYSLTSLIALFSRHGLTVTDVSELSIHGGSLRIEVSRSGAFESSSAVSAVLADEGSIGVNGHDYYSGFADDVERRRSETIQLLESLKADGHTIAGYGAAAKGTVLCNHFGIDRHLVDYVVDRSPHKQGLIMPGVGLPIRPVEVLTEEQPDDVLILAWNFADEIIQQQRAYLERGGRFIVPVPELRMVTR